MKSSAVGSREPMKPMSMDVSPCSASSSISLSQGCLRIRFMDVIIGGVCTFFLGTAVFRRQSLVRRETHAARDTRQRS